MKYVILAVYIIISSMPANCQSKIAYGNNPKAGSYVNVGDAKIYYEVYGKGQPIVLLHGGIYGYIDEFAPFIDVLKDTYQVICIATRGHGKSEIGKQPYSYNQRAEDAYKVTRHITKDSVTVLGFSDGGYSGLKLAALHPGLVKKLIVIGAGYSPKINESRKFNYNSTTLLQQAKGLFEKRLSLMPEPDRWEESLSMSNNLYNNDPITGDIFSKIKCPTLIMSGDRDEYLPVENIVKAHRYIQKSELSIIAGCGHVVFLCNFPSVWATIQPFLNSSKN